MTTFEYMQAGKRGIIKFILLDLYNLSQLYFSEVSGLAYCAGFLVHYCYYFVAVM